MRDLTILMDTTQGRPARLLADLADAGIRVYAGCLFPRLEGRVAHVAVDDEDVDGAREVVTGLGATLGDVRDCVVVPPGYEGGAAGIAAKVAEAGVTVHVAYFGSRGEVILGSTELEATRQALGI